MAISGDGDVRNTSGFIMVGGCRLGNPYVVDGKQSSVAKIYGMMDLDSIFQARVEPGLVRTERSLC